MLIGIFDSLGAQTDRLRCEVCQNLILSPMNTGLLRHAVLQQLLPFTVLKLGGKNYEHYRYLRLQQLLPFTVLKLLHKKNLMRQNKSCNSSYRLRY